MATVLFTLIAFPVWCIFPVIIIGGSGKPAGVVFYFAASIAVAFPAAVATKHVVAPWFRNFLGTTDRIAAAFIVHLGGFCMGALASCVWFYSMRGRTVDGVVVIAWYLWNLGFPPMLAGSFFDFALRVRKKRLRAGAKVLDEVTTQTDQTIDVSKAMLSHSRSENPYEPPFSSP